MCNSHSLSICKILPKSFQKIWLRNWPQVINPKSEHSLWMDKSCCTPTTGHRKEPNPQPSAMRQRCKLLSQCTAHFRSCCFCCCCSIGSSTRQRLGLITSWCHTVKSPGPSQPAKINHICRSRFPFLQRVHWPAGPITVRRSNKILPRRIAHKRRLHDADVHFAPASACTFSGRFIWLHQHEIKACGSAWEKPPAQLSQCARQ